LSVQGFIPERTFFSFRNETLNNPFRDETLNTVQGFIPEQKIIIPKISIRAADYTFFDSKSM